MFSRGRVVILQHAGIIIQKAVIDYTQHQILPRPSRDIFHIANL